jgi:hypothetical protein
MNILALTAACTDFYPQTGRTYLGGNSLNVAAMWKLLAPGAQVSLLEGAKAGLRTLAVWAGVAGIYNF